MQKVSLRSKNRNNSFQNVDKCTAESGTMDRNQMYDEEFGFLKFLKLKYIRGDQII